MHHYAHRILFMQISVLFIIDIANENLSFLFFVPTKIFLLAERPFNPTALRTRQTVSGETEIENFLLNSAVTFTALKSGFFTNFLILNLLSRLVNFVS